MPTFSELIFAKTEATRTGGMTRKELLNMQRFAKNQLGWTV
jgi:hypothetical protein